MDVDRFVCMLGVWKLHLVALKHNNHVHTGTRETCIKTGTYHCSR